MTWKARYHFVNCLISEVTKRRQAIVCNQDNHEILWQDERQRKLGDSVSSAMFCCGCIMCFKMSQDILFSYIGAGWLTATEENCMVVRVI